LGKDYPIKVIREKAVQAHPLLARWGEPTGPDWAYLMFTESVAMVSTMLDLMRDHSIPSLAVHVPRDNQGETAASIRMRRRGWTDGARA
jgi:hypothetical protein